MTPKQLKEMLEEHFQLDIQIYNESYGGPVAEVSLSFWNGEESEVVLKSITSIPEPKHYSDY